MNIGWVPKKDRDNREIPGCWITDAGYTVAEFLVDDQQVYTVTAPGESVAMAYRSGRDGVVQAITDRMAGLAVAKFEGEGA
ncbi:hypothetical protein H3221_013470 [Pseudomonas sp. LMG 31766]|uniref:Uncharacterized protein n=1 Tax=Pseudomonas chaetocerotis TaxID=2758695 RepID=A0A931GB34_9PSED|nr:hypothetical protein [Pseudomonas chaetocerotis]MBZ9665761.1 hypothetical protein [Pseudomonas chaetocerotis]